MFRELHKVGLLAESLIMYEMTDEKNLNFREESTKSMGGVIKIIFSYGEKKFSTFVESNANGQMTTKMISDFKEEK